MNKKALILIVVLFVFVIGFLCFINLYEKNENEQSFADAKTLQLNEEIDIAGQNTSTGEEVKINATVERVLLHSESIAIYYQFDKPENFVTSGINDIEVVMKNGEICDLWNECEGKSMSYDKERKEAVTYIAFSESLPLQEIEKIKVANKYLAIL